MKILICGGRDFGCRKKNRTVDGALLQTAERSWGLGALDMFNRLNKVSHVIEGGAPGADKIARDWAKQRNVPNTTYNAEWSKHGPSAGPIRNGRMLEDNPDIEFVIALPGGRGTANMIEQAQTKGIRVIRFSKPASK